MVGEIAASLGHEMRNPMTSVRGFLQMFMTEELLTPYHEYFDLMIEELDRANQIISEFLSLAKNKTITLEESNLKLIIEALSPLIAVDAPSSKGENLSDRHSKT
jgi:signal transduction histidine kinase